MIQTKHRTIKTEIPNPEDLELIKKLDSLEPKSSHRNLPIVWNKAENFSILDRYGNKFIDFSSGIFVSNSGHSNQYIKNNAIKQLDSNLLYCYSFPTEIKLKFLGKLTKFTGYDKAVLMNTGTEAVETAIKIMRLCKNNKGILSFRNGMHGKSQLTLNLRDNYTDYRWISHDPDIYHLNHPLDCPETSDLYKNFDNIAGIIIESYRGWDAQFFPIEYIQNVVKWSKENDILICFDEIQAGFSRTGKLFAWHWYDLPENSVDIVCVGKALGNGIPISAVLSSKEIIDKADSITNDFSSTYSGNPLSCSLALANLDYMEKNDLVNESERKGKILERIKDFEKFDIVERTNSRGLVGAIIFKNKEMAEDVCMKCLQNGLILVNTGRESLKIGPPLTITDDALTEGLDVLEDMIEIVEHDIVEKES